QRQRLVADAALLAQQQQVEGHGIGPCGGLAFRGHLCHLSMRSSRRPARRGGGRHPRLHRLAGRCKRGPGGRGGRMLQGWAIVAGTLATAAAGGLAAVVLGVPAGALLGSSLTVALLSVLTGKGAVPPRLRDAGFATI